MKRNSVEFWCFFWRKFGEIWCISTSFGGIAARQFNGFCAALVDVGMNSCRHFRPTCSKFAHTSVSQKGSNSGSPTVRWGKMSNPYHRNSVNSQSVSVNFSQFQSISISFSRFDSVRKAGILDCEHSCTVQCDTRKCSCYTPL